MHRLTLTTIVCIAAVLFLTGPARTDDAERTSRDSVAPDDRLEETCALFLGPVPGLTTTWHAAPRATALPLGTVAFFRVEAAPAATVVWDGAIEFDRDGRWSIALCPLLAPGAVHVEARVHVGDRRSRGLIDLAVLDVPVDDIAVSPIDVAWEGVEIPKGLDQRALNARAIAYHFGESIAAVRRLGAGRYLTSVDRTVRLGVRVEPAAFTPLVEWRVDGVATGIGPRIAFGAVRPGEHRIEAGPTAAASRVVIETYRAIITSPPRDTYIPQGEPVVFTASTVPPGYENEIRWMSSTKFGAAVPLLGTGPVFVTEFHDTFHPDPHGPEPWQWIGVKADSAAMEQDQGPPVRLEPCDETCPPTKDDCWCEYDVVDFFGAGCDLLGIDGDAVFCTTPCDPDEQCTNLGTFLAFDIKGNPCEFIGRAVQQPCSDCDGLPFRITP